ncbi:LacI family DNA-binding transcriptional regulator [Coraliomargarita sp. W4R53]
MKNATMKAIAEEAGVSLTTVSCILNKKNLKYSAATKDRIHAIAERLKYRPNALIHGMQTGKSGMAGVMIPNNTWFYSQINSGIHDIFSKSSTLMLLNWNYKCFTDEDLGLERSIIHQMIERRVEGILLRPSFEGFEESYFEEILQRNIPLILVDRELADLRTDYVGTDDAHGGQEAARHLLALGHRHALYVGASRVSTSQHREHSFQLTWEQANKPRPKTIDCEADTFQEKLLKLFKLKKNRPTAVFCINDSVAGRVIALAEEIGLSVPTDLSILGFGNERLDHVRHDLSTLQQHPIRIGQEAAKLYLDRISNPKQDGTQSILIKPDLLSRGTTCKLK